MDPITLSVAAATLLARRALDAFGGDAGSSAWKGIEKLVGLIRMHFRGDGGAGAALGALEAAPDQQANVDALAAQLRAHLEQDPDFLRQLEALVRDAGAHSGGMAINISGDAKVGSAVNIGTVQGSVTL
jgi:hypothetical protein